MNEPVLAHVELSDANQDLVARALGHLLVDEEGLVQVEHFLISERLE